MARRGLATGWLVGQFALLALFGGACGKPKSKPLPPPVASVAHTACEGGETRDPPHQEARPAIQALRNKDYAGAEKLFAALLSKYPESASLSVWRGDALLGEDTEQSVSAALVAYSEARALDARGCKLRDREHYFLALGLVKAALAQKQPQRALAELAAAQQKWPESAELSYQRARAECLQSQPDDCFNDLEHALKSTHADGHVRFSRAHHAAENLLERAEAQSEFVELRKQARCKSLFETAARIDAGVPAP
ncbi:MAG TPA: tetratricopeptide repeat protein [Polyangiaceae bacterium]